MRACECGHPTEKHTPIGCTRCHCGGFHERELTLFEGEDLRGPMDLRQPSPFRYVETVTTDSTAPYQPHSDTSREAAEAVKGDLGRLQAVVLEWFRRQPDGATDEQMIRELGLAPNTVRPRRIELVKAGWLTDSGERRANESGRMATVWRVA